MKRTFVVDDETTAIALYSCIRSHLSELDPDDDPEYTARLSDAHRNIANAIGWPGLNPEPMLRKDG